jgi:hypothetical protein
MLRQAQGARRQES